MVGISGKYRLDTRLGGGGMAEVFVGSTVGAEGFSRKVAIKRVLPGYSDNPAFAQMFVEEAQISSRLVHPNIVSVVDFDRDPDQRLFLVMELVEGRDLDTLVSSGLLPFPVVIYLISEVLRGLGHAHDLPVGNDVRGVIHRDVSPHNVLLSWEGAVKVSDFGIAKARAASEATASVFIKGKPAYMSPEQANGQALDGRSDLFAVGIMLWEMLVGRRLFTAEDTRATLAAVLFGQIPRPRSLRGDVPKDLERVTMKLLERDLPARYATAELAIRDLLDCGDAPKDGRALLIQTLLERFPDHAPVRQSVMRSRGGTPPQVQPLPGPPHERATIADGGAGRRPTPAAAVPSLGAMRGAATSTLDPNAYPAPRRRRTPLIVAGVLASAGLTFGIVTALTHTGGDHVATPGSGSQGVATAAPLPAPDAAPVAPAPPPPAPPPDASAVAAEEPAKKDARSPQPAHAGPDKRVGHLVVKAFPILTVYVDNKKIHDTPVELALPVGKHTLRLASETKTETVSVTITENKTTTIDRE